MRYLCHDGRTDCSSVSPLSRISAPVNPSRRFEPSHPVNPDATATDSAPAPEERPSRSARKRQALALQELGVRLTRLKPAQLQQLPLPEQLLEAVLEAQQL